jgi:CBS domain-containing protein
VTPQTPVSQVATMMRDLNIGDVLVVEEGKLRGIVTDRDLTINVLTNGANAKALSNHTCQRMLLPGLPIGRSNRLLR